MPVDEWSKSGIHLEQAGNDGERQGKESKNGQNLHGFVLLGGEQGIVRIAKLTQKLGDIFQDFGNFIIFIQYFIKLEIEIPA